ncbi:MAG: hypothetical protein AB1631_26555 [Acidobacteriota bacterium]
MKRLVVLLKRSMWPTLTVILVGVVASVVASRSSSQEMTQNSPRRFEIVINNFSLDFKLVDMESRRSRARLTLRNDYDKTITAFAIGRGNSRIKVDLIGTNKVIAPGGTFTKEVSLPSAVIAPNKPDSHKYALSILAVVFEDGTGDGSPSVVREILDSRRKKSQPK